MMAATSDIQAMKKSITLSLFVACIALAWSGCKDCPKDSENNYEYTFPAGITDNVPYIMGDSFMMVDSFGNSAIYAVMNRSYTQPKAPQCDCCPTELMDNMEWNINRGSAANGLRFMLQQQGAGGVESNTYLTCWIDSIAFKMEFDTAGNFGALPPHTSSIVPVIRVGSHTYLDVLQVSNGVTDSLRANTIWYSTQYGLLRYKKFNGEVWSLP